MTVDDYLSLVRKPANRITVVCPVLKYLVFETEDGGEFRLPTEMEDYIKYLQFLKSDEMIIQIGDIVFMKHLKDVVINYKEEIFKTDIASFRALVGDVAGTSSGIYTMHIKYQDGAIHLANCESDYVIPCSENESEGFIKNFFNVCKSGEGCLRVGRSELDITYKEGMVRVYLNGEKYPRYYNRVDIWLTIDQAIEKYCN